MNIPSSTFLLCSQLSLRALMHRLVWAFAARICDRYHNLMNWLISWKCHSSRPRIMIRPNYTRFVRLCVHYLGNHELSGPSVCSFMIRRYLEFDLVWACWVFIHFKAAGPWWDCANAHALLGLVISTSRLFTKYSGTSLYEAPRKLISCRVRAAQV